MNKIWCRYLYYNIGVNHTDSQYLMNSNNKWNDVYQNNYYYSLISKHGLINQYIFTLTNKEYNHTKIKLWVESTENPFFNQEYYDRLWDSFIKTQKMYYTLSKFINKCKLKSISVKVNTDLNLNVISLRPGQSIYLLQDGALYYFTISDLINITNSALTYSYQFFSEAYCPKNPYTNNKFSYSILLKIYYSIRFSYYKMPMLFEMFYRSNFNIRSFKRINEFFIREECIKCFMNNADIEDQYEYIEEMLELKPFREKIIFDDNFPRNILVKAMKPYLFMYIISKYSLRSSQKLLEYKIMLRQSLLKFKEENPSFGRKIYRLKKTNFFSNHQNIITKQSEYITDYKDSTIILPTFRQLISEILLKDEYEDDDSDDSDDSDEDEDDDSEIYNVEILNENIINIRETTRVDIAENNLLQPMSEDDSDDDSFLINDTDSMS